MDILQVLYDINCLYAVYQVNVIRWPIMKLSLFCRSQSFPHIEFAFSFVLCFKGCWTTHQMLMHISCRTVFVIFPMCISVQSSQFHVDSQIKCKQNYYRHKTL